MNKISLLILSLILITTLSFSQSIKIVYNGNVLNNNAVIDTSGAPTDLFASLLGLKNITTSAVQIKVKKIINYALNGSDVSFCFAGNCFDPSVIISPTVASINPNTIDTSFTADYAANGKSGVSSVTYAFFNINAPGDTTKVTINYTTSVGINEISKSDIHFSDAYPNPATNSTTIAYSYPKTAKTAEIIISNILGSKVTEIQLNDFNSKKTIDISNLNKGVYFYSLIVNDKIYYTKKLIVK